MTSPVRKERRSAPSLSRILDVSAGLFERNGFQNTTMQDIADALQIAKPTLYVHAKTKMQILEGIFSQVMGDAEQFLEEALRLSTPEERLEAAVRYWVSAAISRRAHYLVFFGDQRELPPSLRRKYRGWADRCYHSVRTIIEEGQRSRSFSDDVDATAMTFAIIGMTTWSARWFHEAGGHLSPDNVGENCWRLVARGLLTSSTKPPSHNGRRRSAANIVTAPR